MDPEGVVLLLMAHLRQGVAPALAVVGTGVVLEAAVGVLRRERAIVAAGGNKVRELGCAGKT